MKIEKFTESLFGLVETLFGGSEEWRRDPKYLQRLQELVETEMTPEAVEAYRLEHGEAGLLLELSERARRETGN